MPKSSTILRKARKLLARNRAWIRKMPAADRNSQPVEPTDRHACHFCAVGSVMRVMGVNNDIELRMAVPDKYPGVGVTFLAHRVAAYNDNCVASQEEALAWFDKAIAMAKAAGD